MKLCNHISQPQDIPCAEEAEWLIYCFHSELNETSTIYSCNDHINIHLIKGQVHTLYPYDNK